MSKWKKFKKYLIPDLSKDEDFFSLGSWGENSKEERSENETLTSMPKVDNLIKDYGFLSSDLKTNINWFKNHFSIPKNTGVIIREITIGQLAIKGAILYVDGQVNWEHLNQTVLTPLMTMDEQIDQISADLLKEQILTKGQTSKKEKLGQIVNDILMGSAAVLAEGLNVSIIVEVKGWEKRSIENPKTEVVIRGSQEAFTEDIQTNLSMIRRRLRTPDLMIELGSVGNLSRTDIAIVYLKSIANSDLVGEVRKRIATIDYDYIGDSGMIEQLIEDHPNAIYPSILSTERPDRVSAQLADGYVSIIVNNSPFALIVPAQFFVFLQTAEDSYLRWPYSSFLRIVRIVGYFLSLYLPAVYVAIANYHQEMIPTTLILAIAATRETVPLPVAAETVMLECMFELIREAGVRIPSVIGPTIGIVGALILGQAAVQANLVSPIVVIITAITALASYSIPNYNMQFATRILRFVYLIAASILGLVGIVLVWITLISFRVSSRTFGVPVLSQKALDRKSEDKVIRKAIKKQKYRPLSIRPKLRKKIQDKR
ncbi:spore germination protein [Halalkalibacter nanhaiisediminis]|uniref:Spore germination protein KA n=1 Tax=Halalkalibacter nanhaiisediminis TaxID=688079 RepID=A0A562QQJ7_9BACI|nr:spore germination protein [Halalkalibacter nanhaiisediminis]TWI59019.1 spore germination protein KA [Halalkalibacter nanhaiisediminis]